jgi:hypothetical protein
MSEGRQQQEVAASVPPQQGAVESALFGLDPKVGLSASTV